MAKLDPVDSELNNTMQAITVMVKDDDEDWIFISKRILKKAGVEKEIMTAKNGLDAFEKLQTLAQNADKLPDVILLDIKMPVMDGFGLLEQITKESGFDLNHTKIFMCSSSMSAVDKKRANNFPIAGFLTKPITVEDLQKALC